MDDQRIRHFIRRGRSVCGVSVRPDDRDRATTDECAVTCGRCSFSLQAAMLRNGWRRTPDNHVRPHWDDEGA